MINKFRKLLLMPIIITFFISLVFHPIEAKAFKAGAHSVLSADVAKELSDDSVIKEAMLKYPGITAWGATGPDIPANTAAIVIDRAPWFERYHYEKAGKMGAEQLRLALESGDEQAIAFAAGWVTHEIGDLYCHGVYVNPDPEVGGVYLAKPDSKEMHGKLEAYADKILYEDKTSPKKEYNRVNMLTSFGFFRSSSAIQNLQLASLNVHGMTPSVTELLDWTDFFTKVYLTTGAAGVDNWVYSNSYKEASDKLKGGFQNRPGEPFYNMNRMQRLNLAYSEAKQFAVQLLTEAEEGNYNNFSDEWNLDAYHLDNRSIGTLTVTIRTDTESGSGTDDDVRFGMVLENGDTWESLLDKSLYNDFEAGDFDDYYLYVPLKDFPIDQIKQVYLKKESDGILGGAWKVRNMRVSVNGQDIFNQNIDTWLEDGSLTRMYDVVREEMPQTLYVGLKGEADAYLDKIHGFAYTLNSFDSIPYQGEVLINIKRENGTSENYSVNTDEKGEFSYNVQLKPQDYVKLAVDSVDEENDYITYSGRLDLGFASVPFERINFTGDAFNDVIKGEVSGKYSGQLEILIQNGKSKRELNAKAALGKFSVPVSLTGGDSIKVSLRYENAEFPREPIFYDANLDTLEIKYTKTSKDLNGTITNNYGINAKPYTGEVKLYELKSKQLAAKQNAKAQKKVETKQPGSIKTVPKDNPVSVFSFKDAVTITKLGFSIVIEHDGIIKKLEYDPLSGVNEQANLSKQKDAYSVMKDKIDPRINPFENSLSPIDNSINPSLNQSVKGINNQDMDADMEIEE